jgi:DNA-binding NarL/FixJ family response regulator
MYSHSVAGDCAMTAAPPIRLLLVDDHGIVREGLRALLDEDEGFVIVGEASNGDEACDAARRLAPDIVLMDLKMPGMAASDAIRVIRATSPDVKVVALTSYAEDGQVREIMAAGAQGYILKDVTKSDFVTALRTVANGQTWLHPLAQRSLVEQLRNRQADPLALLTQRERSVLDLIARGMSNRQIGDELHLTEGTVKGYVSTILAKLKLEDRTQAALFAVQRGMGRPVR